MSRKKNKKIKIRKIKIEDNFNNILISKFINLATKKGKKIKSKKMIYKSLNLIKKNYNLNPIKIFSKAIELSSPTIEIKKKKIGGSYYKIPIKINKKRSNYIAMKWIIKNSLIRKEKNNYIGIFKEIIDTYNEISNTIKDRDKLYKNAEQNRAFTHFIF
ncbi:MAG: 30S ribosomal protein S7 [Candidatus Vidania fulgoroideorum]